MSNAIRPSSGEEPVTVPRSQLRFRSLLAEIVRGVASRPWRVALTVAGTILGTATLVAVLGLTSSAQGQISDRFSVLRATEVSITSKDTNFAMGGFPEDAGPRVERLAGVNSAGVAWPISSIQWDSVSLSPTSDSGRDANTDGIPVFAADPGFLMASKAEFRDGRNFDPFCTKNACQIALLGEVAARRLGVAHPMPHQAVFIDGTPWLIVGIISNQQRNTQVLGGVVVPSTTAKRVWGNPNDNAWMTIDTQIGAASLIGREAPLALRANAPDSYSLALPPDPKSLQKSVSSDLTGLFLALAAITVLVGAFSIANLTTVAVMERIPEIGLRRALGAKRAHIGVQFVGESSVLGLIGGLFGTPLGIFTVIAVCALKNWTALLPGWLLLTPLLGLLVGFLAGIYPALRAARVEPVSALQR